jgi:hypothetical protein
MCKCGRKQVLKTVAEEDLLYAKTLYCYLANNRGVIKRIKRGMNKRYRKELREDMIKELQIA